jgi:hypothetical protein
MMTITFATTLRPHPVILADVAWSKTSLFSRHIAAPLHRSEYWRFSRQAAIKCFRQKVVNINSQLTIGVSGDQNPAVDFIGKVLDNKDQITSASDLNGFCEYYGGLHREASAGNSVIIGVLVEGSKKSAFRLTLPGLILQQGDTFCEGSGTDIVKRIQSASIKVENQRKTALQVEQSDMLVTISYLLSHDKNTKEGQDNWFGGAYTGFIHDGTGFIRIEDFTAVFIESELTDRTMRYGSDQDAILSFKWIGEHVLLRSRELVAGFIPAGRKSELHCWTIPPLICDQPIDEKALKAASSEGFQANNVVVCAEVHTRTKIIPINLSYSGQGLLHFRFPEASAGHLVEISADILGDIETTAREIDGGRFT